jgi:hypothetical protein
MPKNCKEIKVEGRKIHFTEIEPQEKQKLVKVHLTSPVSGDFSIRLSYSRNYKDGIGKVLTARPVEVLNEDEYILIGSREELQIVPLEETTLRPVSPDELPARLVKLTEIPVFIACHRVDKDARLSVALVQYGQAEGVETAVDKAEYEVFFSPRGKEMVRASFEVRNTHNQFMPMKLPKGAIVLSVRSMDRAITPLRLKDGVMLIPLEKSIESFSGYVTFPVDICYILSEEIKTGRQISAVLPSLGVSISYLKWRLILSVDTKIKWKRMDADPVSQFTDEKAAYVLEYVRAAAGGETPGEELADFVDGHTSYAADALDIAKEIEDTKGEKSGAMPAPENITEERFKKIDFEKLYKKVRAYSKKVAEVERKKKKIRMKGKSVLSSVRKREPEQGKERDKTDIKQKLSRGYSVEAQKAYRAGKLEKAQKDISRALESDIAEEGALQLGANVRRLQQMKEEEISSTPSDGPASGRVFSRERSIEELKSVADEEQRESRIQAQAETYMRKKPGLKPADRVGAYYPMPGELSAAKAERTLLVRYNLLLIPEALSAETGQIFENRAEPVSLKANADYRNWQNTDDFYLLNQENPRGYNRMNLDVVQENTLIDILNRSYGAGNIIASRAVRVSENGLHRIPFSSLEGTKYIEVRLVIVNKDYLDIHVTIPRLDSNGNLKEEETAVRIRRGQTAVLGGISGSVAAVGQGNMGLVLTLNSDILEEMAQEEIESVYTRRFMDISMPAGDVNRFEKFLVKPDEILTITMEVSR